MKNIETKLKLDSFTEIEDLLLKSGAVFRGNLLQIDTYFNSSSGKLKFREINSTEYHLISYMRPISLGAKISDYSISTFTQEEFQKKMSSMTKSLGVEIVVKKNRKLWSFKSTRIHLDDVEGLGTFMELETVIGNKNMKTCKLEHNKVISALNLQRFKSIKGSYSDLLIGLDKHHPVKKLRFQVQS